MTRDLVTNDSGIKDGFIFAIITLIGITIFISGCSQRDNVLSDNAEAVLGVASGTAVSGISVADDTEFGDKCKTDDEMDYYAGHTAKEILLDIDSQIDLIAKEMPIYADAENSESVAYAVADTNRDGRIELIVSRYVDEKDKDKYNSLYYDTIYEVSENREELEFVGESGKSIVETYDYDYLTFDLMYGDEDNDFDSESEARQWNRDDIALMLEHSYFNYYHAKAESAADIREKFVKFVADYKLSNENENVYYSIVDLENPVLLISDNVIHSDDKKTKEKGNVVWADVYGYSETRDTIIYIGRVESTGSGYPVTHRDHGVGIETGYHHQSSRLRMMGDNGIIETIDGYYYNPGTDSDALTSGYSISVLEGGKEKKIIERQCTEAQAINIASEIYTGYNGIDFSRLSEENAVKLAGNNNGADRYFMSKETKNLKLKLQDAFFDSFNVFEDYSLPRNIIFEQEIIDEYDDGSYLSHMKLKQLNEKNNKIPKERLSIGFFLVDRDKVTRLIDDLENPWNLSKNSLNDFIQNGKLPRYSLVVCSKSGIAEQQIRDADKGWYSYLESDGLNLKSGLYYHPYDTWGKESYYWEHFYWKLDKGMVGYECGYKAGVNFIIAGDLE